ncbi:MAG: hypothetical protein IKK92_01505 [Prevotella sp.]|nr:hypothetical protein [Prevotella sp.]
MDKKKKPQLKPLLDACTQFTSDDFSNIDKMNAASEKVFDIYYKQLEESKMLPFTEAERDLMKNAFRVGFIGGVSAGTFALAKEVNEQEAQTAMLTMPRRGGC